MSTSFATETATAEPEFLVRLERIWKALRSNQLREGLYWSFLTAVAALGALALLDYGWELSLAVRGGGLVVAGVLTLLVFGRTVVTPWRWWTRPRTAAEIEARFPMLGQRIRTVVQYAGLSEERIISAGVAPSLYSALAEETQIQVEPLPLDTVVPQLRNRLLAVFAALPVLAIVAVALVDPEWRTTLERLLLRERPYTTFVIAPGDVTVEQGNNLTIDVEMKGRQRRRAVLQTRPLETPGAAWLSIPLEPLEHGPSSRRTTTLKAIAKPLAYRVLAGPVPSRPSRITVRYPLVLRTFEVTLTAPAYTGLKPETVKGGDLRAVEGTAAVFRLAFDIAPREAALLIIDPKARNTEKASQASGAAPSEELIPLTFEGRALTAHLSLTRDLDYRIVARSDDGRTFPRKGYRIDVWADRAPRIGFEAPDEALEVHPIAEVLHRIRVADDFGLSKAGIVYRVNDGEEKTLIAKDFAPQDGRLPASARLEEMLALEALSISSTDSVMYYAFAEDNFPGQPKRTETDLRYIDIRPFKRTYFLADPGGGEGGSGVSTALEELIARQRFNLNRTVRLARHRPGDRTAPEDTLKIASFEELLAALTREVAEGIQGIVGEPFEAMQQAEASMLAAVNALDREKNDEASSLEAQALRHLVEARRTFRFAILQGNRGMMSALRSFDRIQAQKIRKPRSKDEEAEALVAEIEELAGDEDFVYATIAALLEEGGKQQDAEETGAADEPAPQQKAMRGDSQKEQARSERPARDSKKTDRRALGEKQEQIAGDARDLEERLKRLEAASELSKRRMARAAEAAERAAGAMTRGRTEEAVEQAKTGAVMLREVARQVKGETAREVADEIAMARDLAEELAELQAELAEIPTPATEGSSEPDRRDSRSDRNGGSDSRTAESDPERLQRLAEAARTLEEWLKQIAKRGEGKAGEMARELLEQGKVAEILARIERIAGLYGEGREDEARREAAEAARAMEAVARALDMLHRDIVAPQLAALVGLETRLADVTGRLDTLKIDGEVDAWHRDAAALLRELEAKAGMAEPVAALEKAMADAGWHGGGGNWSWDGRARFWAAPGDYKSAIQRMAKRLQDQIQEMILKDMLSTRDEATPPEFKELIERYYEVLSRQGGASNSSR